MTRLGLLLAALLLIGAGPAERFQIRCRIPVGTAWVTTGSSAVKTTITSGPSSTTREESQSFRWDEKVLSADTVRGIVKQVQVIDSQPAFLKGQVADFSVSPRCEQKMVSFDGKPLVHFNPLYQQPAIFPLSTVAVGDSWEVAQTARTTVRGAQAVIPAESVVQGRGTLARAEDSLVIVELDLNSVLRSSQPVSAPYFLESRSHTVWSLGVEPQTGWIAWQKMHTVAEEYLVNGEEKVAPTVRIETTATMTSEKRSQAGESRGPGPQV